MTIWEQQVTRSADVLANCGFQLRGYLLFFIFVLFVLKNNVQVMYNTKSVMY